MMGLHLIGLCQIEVGTGSHKERAETAANGALCHAREDQQPAADGHVDQRSQVTKARAGDHGYVPRQLEGRYFGTMLVPSVALLPQRQPLTILPPSVVPLIAVVALSIGTSVSVLVAAVN